VSDNGTCRARRLPCVPRRVRRCRRRRAGCPV